MIMQTEIAYQTNAINMCRCSQHRLLHSLPSSGQPIEFPSSKVSGTLVHSVEATFKLFHLYNTGWNILSHDKSPFSEGSYIEREVF